MQEIKEEKSQSNNSDLGLERDLKSSELENLNQNFGEQNQGKLHFFEAKVAQENDGDEPIEPPALDMRVNFDKLEYKLEHDPVLEYALKNRDKLKKKQKSSKSELKSSDNFKKSDKYSENQNKEIKIS